MMQASGQPLQVESDPRLVNEQVAGINYD